MDKYNKMNIKYNKSNKNKERKLTPQYNFKKDFSKNINIPKNKNEKIRGSFPLKENQKELSPYIEKKNYVIPKNKKYIRNLSSKNQKENRLFYNVPSRNFNSNDYNSYNKIKQRINSNKSINNKFKKVNYIEIYRKASNNKIIRNNIPLIHINLSNSIRKKNQNQLKETLTPNQTLKRNNQSSNEMKDENSKSKKINNIISQNQYMNTLNKIPIKTHKIKNFQIQNNKNEINQIPIQNKIIESNNINFQEIENINEIENNEEINNKFQINNINLNIEENKIENEKINSKRENEENNIKNRILLENNIKNESSRKLYSSFFYKEDANITSREKMEDFHSIKEKLNLNPEISYFSIFDGHNGDKPAIYCKNNLDKIIIKTLKENNYEIEKSLIESYIKIDDLISKEEFNEESGTTSTTLLIYKKLNDNRKYYACANVGDSQCYLIKKDSVVKISKDHKCNDKEEVDRIKKCGGMVFNGRVFGTLMLTRSIGDKEMKNYGVSSIPFVNHGVIDQINDLFFVIASDGVWDVLNQNDIFHICSQFQYSQDICNEIVKKSIQEGTKDNVSCIVVRI